MKSNSSSNNDILIVEAVAIADPQLAQQYANVQKQLNDKDNQINALLKQINKLDADKVQLQKVMVAIEQKSAQSVTPPPPTPVTPAKTAQGTTTSQPTTATQPGAANQPTQTRESVNILKLKPINEIVHKTKMELLYDYVDGKIKDQTPIQFRIKKMGGSGVGSKTIETGIPISVEEGPSTSPYNLIRIKLKNGKTSLVRDYNVVLPFPTNESLNEDKVVFEPEIRDITQPEEATEIVDNETEHEEIAENDVFYVNVEDEGEAFIGKIYKQGDDDEWKAKVTVGESETFDKLYYEPEWDEIDIIAFLRDNYADAKLISKDEFSAHVILDKDEEITEGLNTLKDIYNYFINVDVSKLDKNRSINKAFLDGYKGKTISININRGTPIYTAWKAGYDRYEKEGVRIQKLDDYKGGTIL